MPVTDEPKNIIAISTNKTYMNLLSNPMTATPLNEAGTYKKYYNRNN
jgi:hypothetical protein